MEEIEIKKTRKPRKEKSLIDKIKDLPEVSDDFFQGEKTLTEVEALRLENHMLQIGNKKMLRDNLAMQSANKTLIAENMTLKLELQKVNIDKIRSESQLTEEQKKNTNKSLLELESKYESYKQQLEEKYMLKKKWGFNPETYEIIDN
jgi:hypothetical protein